ncbi:MAG: NAD(P)H-dependent oxidoreductase [Myxococcota bacterium]|jgi:NAD(P)H dehydrogenase (quinone)|nr:NAD(P)H-dependent oxidoreductase [Myxococcota bacterium]
MKVLIVYCHPNPKSYCHAILETAREALSGAGHEVVVRELYALDFDPVLAPADFEALQAGSGRADVLEEQKHVAWADLLLYVYPIWWTGLPAMLKGYIDRVFNYGFAYVFEATGPVGLLKGKKSLAITTQGTPRPYYQSTGMEAAMVSTQDQGIWGFCGIEALEHVFLGDVIGCGDEQRKALLEELEQRLAAL